MGSRQRVVLVGAALGALALASCFLINPPPRVRWRPRLYAVEWPISVNQAPDELLRDHFPEGAGLARDLRPQELSSNDGSVWGVVAYLEPWMFARLEASGARFRVVPDRWDERLLYNGGLGAVPPGPPPDDGPLPIGGEATCSPVGPEPGTFCPYTTARSGYLEAEYPGWTCNVPLYDQLEDGDASHPPVLGEDYYELVDLGSSNEGRTIRGVRLGRQSEAGGDPVPQLVVIAGQHTTEWGPIEYARQLIFRLADEMRDGDPGVRAALTDVALLIVPVVNPDGYDYAHTERLHRAWRVNRQPCPGEADAGRDLNRNHPFAWGLNLDGSSDVCGDTEFRGRAPADAPETQVLRSAVADPAYRTVLLDNIHGFGGDILATEGYSRGELNEATSACGDDDNCTAPDLGLVYRLVGTEADPILTNVRDPSIPYATGQGFRELYAVNGDTVADLSYGSLPGSGTRNLVSLLIEEDGQCGFEAERLLPGTLAREVENYRALILHQLGALPALASGTTAEFELPLVGRRNQPGRLAAEPATFRIAVRNDLTGVSVENDADVPGATAEDDVRPGARYSMFRWRPDGGGYVFPRLMSICADGVNCRTAWMGGPPGDTVDLCSPDSIFLRGSAWSWTGQVPGETDDECFNDLVAPGVTGASATVTSIYYDFSHVTDAHIVFDLQFHASSVGARNVGFDVEVSSNGFVDCSFANYGACRIARRMELFGAGYRYYPNDDYRTLVADVSDFDGQGAVQFRIRVFHNGPNPSPPGESRLRLFGATPIGWYAP